LRERTTIIKHNKSLTVSWGDLYVCVCVGNSNEFLANSYSMDISKRILSPGLFLILFFSNECRSGFSYFKTVTNHD
jgi:hypothetical protein